MSETGLMTKTVLQITIDEFDLILTILGIAGVAYAAWLYRHERWFRDIVFPVVQALTGKSPRGDDVTPTRDGIMEETDDRLSHLENEIHDVRDDVRNLSRNQRRHNFKTSQLLTTIAENVEGIDEDEIPDREPFFRGDSSDEESPVPDGGESPAGGD